MIGILRAQALLLTTVGLFAQQSQSPSSVNLSKASDGTKTLGIHNVSFLTANSLLLRKTTDSKRIIGEKGMEGLVAVEAWPLETDLRQKPLYAIKVTGADAQIFDFSLLAVSRGLEETEWWSVYKLGTGQHLFDTYVPLVSFSTAREVMKTRYAGLEIPPDHTKDTRLKQPKVIAVLTYASADHVMHEWLLTCDDPKRAQLLKSYSDVTRRLSVGDQTLTLGFRENYPSPANPIDIVIPIAGDDLDIAHASLPPRIHLTSWRR